MCFERAGDLASISTGDDGLSRLAGFQLLGAVLLFLVALTSSEEKGRVFTCWERSWSAYAELPEQPETFPLAVLRRDGKTLYVALIDTHEKNHGRGIRIFEEGGVKVEVGLQEHLVGAFLKPYLLG